MRHVPLSALAAALAVASFAPASAADLALKRVLLSTGGVGYFEYEAEVDGATELALPVRRDLVDDVLKSLVVYDDRGRVGRVSLPGAESEQALFRELPFPREALADPVALIIALRGAELVVAGPTPLRGRIVGVRAEPAKPDGTPGRNRVTLMTATGMRQAVLEEADELRFADPALQAQVERALAGLVELGKRETRILRIAVDGDGARRVRVAYVAAAPLWKASYRLTLPADTGAKQAALQGWAVVENESGEDWRAVDLTLVSGNPVTFRQALYAPYYVARPQVPVEVWGRSLPAPPDQGAVALLGKLAGQPGSPPASAPARARLDADQLRQQEARTAQAAGMLRDERMALPEAALLLAADAGEAQTQVSFRAPSPVSVASGHSLVVPIVARDVPIERVMLFRAETNPQHPLASVRLTNAGAAALPPGVVTLYERAVDGIGFLGDARLAPVPVGETRMLSYAVDFKTKVDVDRGAASRLARVRLADGLLHATTIERQTTTWSVSTASGEARRLVIETPKPASEWNVVEPGEGVTRAGNALRIGREIAGGQAVKIALAVERPVEERVELSSLAPDRLAAFLRSNALSARQQDALRRLGQLAQVHAEAKKAVSAGDAEIKRLVEDQRRVRDNISYVQGDQQRVYREKLGALEERIVQMQLRGDAAREAAERAERALAEFVRALEA